MVNHIRALLGTHSDSIKREHALEIIPDKLFRLLGDDIYLLVGIDIGDDGICVEG